MNIWGVHKMLIEKDEDLIPACKCIKCKCNCCKDELATKKTDKTGICHECYNEKKPLHTEKELKEAMEGEEYLDFNEYQ